jgi:hypothetical protein
VASSSSPKQENISLPLKLNTMRYCIPVRRYRRVEFRDLSQGRWKGRVDRRNQSVNLSRHLVSECDITMKLGPFSRCVILLELPASTASISTPMQCRRLGK